MSEPSDMTNWPRDPASQRYLCSPEHPMPANATGQWAHTNVEDAGECSRGCCDIWRCKDCGYKWNEEVAE